MTRRTPHRAPIAAAASIAFAMATLVACGNNNPSTQPEEQPTTSAVTPPDFDSSTPPPAPSITPYMTATPRPTVTPTRLPNLPSATPGQPGTPRGLPAAALRPDRANADQVATAFALLLTTHDTRLDNQPADAGRRAAWLATPDLAAQLRSAPPGGNPGAQWNELSKHGGYIRTGATDATEAGAPPDTATRAVRAIRVTSLPTATGWSGDEEIVVVFVDLVRTGRTWMVRDHSIQ